MRTGDRFYFAINNRSMLGLPRINDVLSKFSSYRDKNLFDNTFIFIIIFIVYVGMDKHRSFLRTSCRLCGNQVKGKCDVADKQSFKLELWLRFQINVDVDNDEIHPSVICPACKRILYRIRGATDPTSVSTSKQPFLWRRHDDQDCYCVRKRAKVGRPSKKKAKKPCSEKLEGSDAESGEESETEHEMDSCQQFRNLMQNIKLMDKELALTCAENLSENSFISFFWTEKIWMQESRSCLWKTGC